MKKLVVLSGPLPTQDDRRLVAFAARMGVEAKIVALAEPCTFTRRMFDGLDPKSCAIALSGETLAALAKASSPDSDLSFLSDDFPALLVFGCNASPKVQNALSLLTGGAVSGVAVLTSQTPSFAFPGESRPLTRQLSGLGFSEKCSALLATFDVCEGAPGADVLMTADGRPLLVRVQRGSREVLLFGGPAPDIDAPLGSGRTLESHYVSIVPPLIFLRLCFGDSVWHAPESTARLIVDDPTLSRRYGFLDFAALLESMNRLHYGTTIAFIPWNAWRTSKRAVARLLGYGSNLSICIHGCDHTNREFQASSPGLLDAKAWLAMERMIAQRQRTGAPFENVMVFPQGRFSTAAPAALRACNYLAAVNSTCFPADARADDLSVGDFLEPAIARYGGLPIFQRRYPRRLFDLAFDLFLGKPALIVEHHEYFKHGLGDLEELVAALNYIEPALSWPDLTTQLSRCCLTRTTSSDATEVRFFTPRFQFENRDGKAGRFLLSKPEPQPEMVASVLVDGAAVPFSFEDGCLRIEFEACRGEVRNIEVLDRERPHSRTRRFVYPLRVLLRRGLSEFRDNTLARHSGLLKVARKLAKMVKATGED